MSEIQFAVSAKTARLIGRENISDVGGAVIELIKNSYDADATCVFVVFDMPFPSIPGKISFEVCDKVFDNQGIRKLVNYYHNEGNYLSKIEDLSEEQEKELAEFLYSKNSIYIVDNGCGMNERIIRTAWMNIGTNDKEENRVSEKGRVKTGAKGIGRFALDKLSTETTVYTKSRDDSLIKWNMNWNQFETASLLSEVKATIETLEIPFSELAQRFADGRFNGFNNYTWDTGTMIRLSPTRETWSESLFRKVNKDLKSIFPGTNDSEFDMYVFNVYYPQYAFVNERFLFNNSEFDYKIIGSYNGDDSLSISLVRNEVDTRKIKDFHDFGEKKIELKFGDFWKRISFQKNNYRRADFAKTVKITLSASEATKISPFILKSIGPFDVELYFLRNASNQVEIMKPVVSANRKEILTHFSGIKLYRDGFKVRPYGEESGPSYDWLNLGLRAQRSPAPISHDSGSWRVRTNQIIGAVKITKEGNPNLIDMANREGLAVNDSFVAFVTLIDKIIETFEADRQYVYREYGRWIREIKNNLSVTDEMVRKAKEEMATREVDNKTGAYDHTGNESDNKYSNSQYNQTILELEEARERQERASKTLMLYCASGVMTNTFAHEISHIMTQLGSRMQHIRYSVQRILGEDGYTGNRVFNPYIIISRAEEVDSLLESWIDVLMSGAGNEVFTKGNTNVIETLEQFCVPWRPLLEKKLISLKPIALNGKFEDCVSKISKIDLLIILNNFLLNSAYFLGKITEDERTINLSISSEEKYITVDMVNNGPPLDGVFKNNPDRIFDAGVSTKQTRTGKGSGIGLWIVHTLVSENSGEIHPIDMKDGFGLRILLPK